MAKGGNSVADNSTTGATGGAATSGVGTTKYSGGNGATGTTSSNYGGGGGSSAGTGGQRNNCHHCNRCDCAIWRRQWWKWPVEFIRLMARPAQPQAGLAAAPIEVPVATTYTGGDGANGQIRITYYVAANATTTSINCGAGNTYRQLWQHHQLCSHSDPQRAAPPVLIRHSLLDDKRLRLPLSPAHARSRALADQHPAR